MRENMSKYMLLEKQVRKASTEEFSEELGVSRSCLQEYLNGSGNPTLSTVEHIAKALNVDPITLLSGPFSSSQLHVLHLLFDSIGCISDLDQEKRAQFANLLLQIITLWEEK